MTSLTCLPLHRPVDPATAFALIAEGSPYAFWLDSARSESPMSRYSYIGAPLAGGTLRYERAGSNSPQVQVLDAAGQVTGAETGTIWQVLENLTPATRPNPADLEGADYPVDALAGGYVGYMGYEAHADLPPVDFHREHPHRVARTQDALWLPASHYLTLDHATGRAWLVGPAEWARKTAVRLAEAPSSPAHIADAESIDLPDFPLPDRTDYLEKVRTSQQEIYEGNSYEVCLTAETSARLEKPLTDAQLLALYRAQRAHNPAPYAGYLRCGDFTVLSSSPERFLTVTAEGKAESKPIKGTVPRGATPQEDAAAAAWLAGDAKTRAENLMIVDLLRNDLSTVCDPASVRVPVLMGVESYSTVHQLVSTITGQLRPGVSAVGAAAACFPGGSMTGAPKASTMAIIDRLEGRARGVYSGAMGYFSADGSAGLSIVIRTLVAHADGLVTLAAGGAIVADSDPVAEYEEMVTKLKAAIPR